MKSPKIIYMGTPDFAVEPLKKLYNLGYNICAVVTMPDKPQGRGRKIAFSPVKQFAIDNNIMCLQPEKLKDEQFVGTLREINADMFIVVAFRMLPEVVWSMPKMGCFNLHAALLPQYRGAAPLNWAIINGETQTGVTTFLLDKDIDTGGILLQEKVDILPQDDLGTIHDKLMYLGSDLVVKTVEGLVNGSLSPTDQSILAKDTVLKHAPKIFKEDCHLNFENNATDIHNLVRGLSPYPASWIKVEISGKELQMAIFKTKVELIEDNVAVNEVVSDKSSFVKIKCKDGYLHLLEVRLEGKKRMSIKDFLNGTKADIKVL